MDTENFLVRRSQLKARLAERRQRDLSVYAFKKVDEYGGEAPAWLKWGLSLASPQGGIGRMINLGLPFVMPFIAKRRQISLAGKVLSFLRSL